MVPGDVPSQAAIPKTPPPEESGHCLRTAQRGKMVPGEAQMVRHCLADPPIPPVDSRHYFRAARVASSPRLLRREAEVRERSDRNRKHSWSFDSDCMAIRLDTEASDVGILSMLERLVGVRWRWIRDFRVVGFLELEGEGEGVRRESRCRVVEAGWMRHRTLHPVP